MIPAYWLYDGIVTPRQAYLQSNKELTGSPPILDECVEAYHSWYHPLIRVHNDATNDLVQIRAHDPVGFARLAAFVQQLRADSALVDKLLDHGHGSDRTGVISVMKWIGVQKVERLPVWRVKSWDLERQGLKYRLIYCYNWRDQSYNIMAIVPRNAIDYDDPTHPIRQRVTQRIREEFPGA